MTARSWGASEMHMAHDVQMHVKLSLARSREKGPANGGYLIRPCLFSCVVFIDVSRLSKLTPILQHDLTELNIDFRLALLPSFDLSKLLSELV